MSAREEQQRIKDSLWESIKRLGFDQWCTYEDIEVFRPKNPKWGSWTSNIALKIYANYKKSL